MFARRRGYREACDRKTREKDKYHVCVHNKDCRRDIFFYLLIIIIIFCTNQSIAGIKLAIY